MREVVDRILEGNFNNDVHSLSFSSPLIELKLEPGEKHEVLIKDAYLLMLYLKPFRRLINGEKYELEVIFRDGYGDPGVRRKYVGRKDFSVVDQSPWR